MKTDNKSDFQRISVDKLKFRTKKVTDKVIKKGMRSAFDCYIQIIYKKDPEFTPMDILDVQNAIGNAGEEYYFSPELLEYINCQFTDRDINLYADYHARMTLKAIAEKYDIGSTRVKQVIDTMERKMRTFNRCQPDGIHKLKLSTRAYNCIGRIGIHTIDELIEGFEKGTIFRSRNLGKVTLIEIAEALDAFKGTKYREAIRGIEDELINTSKTKCVNIPLRSQIDFHEWKKLDHLVPFKAYRTIAENESFDMIFIHKDIEEGRLYFLKIRDLKILNSCSELDIELTAYESGYKYYQPIIDMIAIDINKYLKGEIIIRKLEA